MIDGGMLNGDSPAFPLALPDGSGCGGLTKREWMATLLAQGMCANSHFASVAAEAEKHGAFVPGATIHEMAVASADALLAELEKDRTE
jgi:hypothetical protein